MKKKCKHKWTLNLVRVTFMDSRRKTTGEIGITCKKCGEFRDNIPAEITQRDGEIACVESCIEENGVTLKR